MGAGRIGWNRFQGARSMLPNCHRQSRGARAAAGWNPVNQLTTAGFFGQIGA
jgi:hypothetical protein